MCAHPAMPLSSISLLNCCFLSLQPSKNSTSSVFSLHFASFWGVEHALTAAMGSRVHSSAVPLTPNSHQQLIFLFSCSLPAKLYAHPHRHHFVFHPFSLINNRLCLRASPDLQAKEIIDVGLAQSHRHK